MKKLISLITASVLSLSCILPVAVEANSGMQVSRESNNGNTKDTVNITWDGEATDATLIAADYGSNGVMNSISTQTITLAQGENSVEKNVYNSDLTRKYMVWNPNNPIALMDAVTVGVNSLPQSYDSSIPQASGTNFEASYRDLDASTGVVEISAPAQFTGQIKTVVMLKKGIEQYSLNGSDILAVNQDYNINRIIVPKLNQTTDKGTYKIYIGGNGSLYETVVTIGETPAPAGSEIGIIKAIDQNSSGDFYAYVYTYGNDVARYQITEAGAALFFDTERETGWTDNHGTTVIAYNMQDNDTVMNITGILQETKEKASYNSSESKIGDIKISDQAKILLLTDTLSYEPFEMSSFTSDKIYDISAYNKSDDNSYSFIVINAIEDETNPGTEPDTPTPPTEIPSFDPSEYEFGIAKAVYKKNNGDFAALIYTSEGEEKDCDVTENSATTIFNIEYPDYAWLSKDKTTVIAYSMQARNTIMNIEAILPETKAKAAYNPSYTKIGDVKLSSQTKIIMPTIEDDVLFYDPVTLSSLFSDKIYDISAYNKLEDGSYSFIIINAVEDAPKYPYTITNLAIENASGTELDAIPDNSGFIARLTFKETIQRDAEDCVIVAVYSKTGVLLSLDYMQTDFDTNKDYKVGFHIAKQSEEIGKIKAFIWSSFGGVPLCNTIEK